MEASSSRKEAGSKIKSLVLSDAGQLHMLDLTGHKMLCVRPSLMTTYYVEVQKKKPSWMVKFLRSSYFWWLLLNNELTEKSWITRSMQSHERSFFGGCHLVQVVGNSFSAALDSKYFRLCEPQYHLCNLFLIFSFLQSVNNVKTILSSLAVQKKQNKARNGFSPKAVVSWASTWVSQQ